MREYEEMEVCNLSAEVRDQTTVWVRGIKDQTTESIPGHERDLSDDGCRPDVHRLGSERTVEGGERDGRSVLQLGSRRAEQKQSSGTG